MRRLEKTSIFTRDVKRLPENIQKEAWEIACKLKKDVFDTTLSIKKLEGYKKVWRVVFRKVYRLIYTFDKECVYLLRIGHRKDIYKLKGLS